MWLSVMGMTSLERGVAPFNGGDVITMGLMSLGRGVALCNGG